jgi:cytidine deaminase
MEGDDSGWSCEIEYLRTRPFSSLSNQDPAYQVAVRLKRFLQRVSDAPLEADFHRLSGRVVLAVVMLRRVDGTYEFYEGVNTEVAIQTGSLCAERAAIAAARADIPNLARFEICAIGTIYAPLTKDEPEPSKNPSWPCGVCNEWIKKACGKSESFRVIGFPNTKFDTVIERFLCLKRSKPVSFSEVALARVKHAPFATPAATDKNTTQRVSDLQGKPQIIEDLVICESCSSVYPAGEVCLLCSPGSAHLIANYSMVAPLRTKRVADQAHASRGHSLEDRVMRQPPSVSP